MATNKVIYKTETRTYKKIIGNQVVVTTYISKVIDIRATLKAQGN
jgi:hypothetical protein